MNAIYNTNDKMKGAVDAWLDKHGEDPNYKNLTAAQRHTIGTEEVLAEMSEKGPVKDPGIIGAMNRAVAATRMWMRKNLGWSLKFTANDIIHMMRDVHESVRNGQASKKVWV